MDDSTPSNPAPGVLWTHLLREFITSGEAARLGPHALAVYCVLQSFADLSTGDITIGTLRIAALSGVSKSEVLRSLNALADNGHLDRITHAERRRGRYRIRHRASVGSSIASWQYTPLAEAQRHKSVSDIRNGRVSASTEIRIEHLTLNLQVVEPGGVGIQNIAIGCDASIHGVDPMVTVRALAWLQGQDVSTRLKWAKRAETLGAQRPVLAHSDGIKGWIGLVAREVADAERW